MQYILTQAEYDELRAKQTLDIKMQRQKLQKLCTLIANTMPVSVSWVNEGKPDPWGCVITAEENGEEWYCDECLVQDICPAEKAWSK